MELYGENVIPGNRAGKGHAVDARGGRQPLVARRREVAVHEVEPAAVGNSRPQRVAPPLQHLVPAHMRNLRTQTLERRPVPGSHPRAPGSPSSPPSDRHLRPMPVPGEGLAPAPPMAASPAPAAARWPKE